MKHKIGEEVTRKRVIYEKKGRWQGTGNQVYGLSIPPEVRELARFKGGDAFRILVTSNKKIILEKMDGEEMRITEDDDKETGIPMEYGRIIREDEGFFREFEGYCHTAKIPHISRKLAGFKAGDIVRCAVTNDLKIVIENIEGEA